MAQEALLANIESGLTRGADVPVALDAEDHWPQGESPLSPIKRDVTPLP